MPQPPLLTRRGFAQFTHNGRGVSYEVQAHFAFISGNSSIERCAAGANQIAAGLSGVPRWGRLQTCRLAADHRLFFRTRKEFESRARRCHWSEYAEETLSTSHDHIARKSSEAWSL